MSNSPFDEATDNEAAEQKRLAAPIRAQLRLHHLFAMTAVTAVLLAINRPRPPSDMPAGFEWPPLLQTAMVGFGIVYTILAAAAVTNVAYGLAWRRQGIAFFHQPGHWLLVSISFVAVTGALWQLLQRLLQPDLEARFQTINPGMIVVNLLTALVWLGALIALRIGSKTTSRFAVVKSVVPSGRSAAPKGRRHVARGASPWKTYQNNYRSPGGATSVANHKRGESPSPLRGFRGIGHPASRACRLWLHALAPSGPLSAAVLTRRNHPKGQKVLTAHRLFDTLPNAEVIFEQSLNIYIAVKHCREHRWKWVFYVKAVAAVIVGLGDIAVIVLLLTAGQADRRQSNGRDASHWCGVWLQLALSSLTIIMMVRTMVLMITFFIRGTFAR